VLAVQLNALIEHVSEVEDATVARLELDLSNHKPMHLS
jgi:hypothetical protein